jgi:hypothetical protein
LPVTIKIKTPLALAETGIGIGVFRCINVGREVTVLDPFFEVLAASGSDGVSIVAPGFWKIPR